MVELKLKTMLMTNSKGKELEVLLCPEYPECPVYIHEDTKKHREAIRKHVKKKHASKKPEMPPPE